MKKTYKGDNFSLSLSLQNDSKIPLGVLLELEQDIQNLAQNLMILDADVTEKMENSIRGKVKANSEKTAPFTPEAG
jgi:hypothetical protein